MRNLARSACVVGLVLLAVAVLRQPAPEPYLVLGLVSVALGLALTVLARRRSARNSSGGRGADDGPGRVPQP
jgi:hypothetical protein